MHAFGTADLQRLAGCSRATIRALIRAGHIKPAKSLRGRRLEFSFRDAIVIRTARGLRAAGVSPRKISRSLTKLRSALPKDIPLSGLRIVASGSEVAVAENRAAWAADTGQYLLALDVETRAGELQFVERAIVEPAQLRASGASADAVRAPDSEPQAPNDHFDRAWTIEETNPAEAILTYQQCLAANAGNYEASVNCGRLLHLAGRLVEAEQVYRAAIPLDATVLFNLGVLLEDAEREGDAIEAYLAALESDPAYGDAHFNLARLYDRAGDERKALRHLMAYRRLDLLG